MRVAMYSPMPPAMSGIADYSEALAGALGRRCDLDVVTGAEPARQPDIALYQIGNNPDHAHAYESALERPGVVVLHEANLHHLAAALTIRRNDWDAYLREVEFDGGTEALEYARRVRALEVGPDYDGVPMLRRILSEARGLIAHSDYVIARAREAGFRGPAARIPHGAWIPEPHPMVFRRRLGLDETTPLIGTFGHLKPYKRIEQSLRAFRRVVRCDPRARMILGGEPHPELPLDDLIKSLDLRESVRVLGRIDGISDFTGYLGACDLVLNLRYPTVGETSGTLLRAFGLGRAALVSDVGAFAEFPDEVCLKVPVNGREEGLLTEYLQLFTARRDLAAAMGARAKTWVEQECNWDRAAELYLEFLECVAAGRTWVQPSAPARPVTPAAAADLAPEPVRVEPAYLRTWALEEEAQDYFETHLTRFEKTLAITPPGAPGSRILEMGAYMQITPALRLKLGYGEVRGCYYGPLGRVERKTAESTEGERFECEIDLFDAEKDRFPYPDGHFHTVLCCELIEHLPTDPMFLMAEANRILADGGHLVLTTPNIASLRALNAMLHGFHPGFFPAYLRPEAAETNARHNREYAPREIYSLFNDAGFTVTLLETGPFREIPSADLHWVAHLLARYNLPTDQRGDGIYAVGIKTGPVRNRFPAWLYSG
ncbi:MAG: methyltransferase domain-containing protein [Acidobacteria bacterium]|nr:methyltransferase domain-containing protein [Acidobacteriota bacterium]